VTIAMPASTAWLLVLGAVAATLGCRSEDDRRVITIWHQSRPAERELLADEIARYEAAHPDVRIRPPTWSTRSTPWA